MELTYQHPKVACDFLKNVSVRPDLDGLTRLTTSFLRLPYENLTKIIRQNTCSSPADRFRLPETVWNDHKALGTGGTCFSLTYFFETILKEAGFDCYSAMVDRSYGNDTHCALIVNIGGKKYLTDPGFCLSRPIEITDRETELRLPHNTYILTPENKDRYRLSTVLLGAARSRYVLKDTPVSPHEFAGFWGGSFEWPMMRHLCITHLNEDGYTYLRDDFLRRTSTAEKMQTRIKKNFDAEVTKIFGISREIVSLASNIVNPSL